MEIRQLQYFVAIADTLNFTRASEVLYISQSALSKQILSLEQELGVVLFDRDKRTVKLSAAGKLLLPEAKEILIRSEKLIPMLKHSKEYAADRSIRIGIDMTLDDNELLHNSLTEQVFLKRRDIPGLRALFWRKDYSEIQRNLVDGTLDLGVYYAMDFLRRDELETKVLWKDRMVLVYRSNTALPDDLDGIRYVLDRRGVILPEKEITGLYWCLQILNDIDCVPQIRFAGSRSAMMFTMESGESTVIVPETVARRLNNPNLNILHFPSEMTELYCVAAWNKESQNALVPEIVEHLYQDIYGVETT